MTSPRSCFAQPPECYPPALAELLAVPGGMDDALGALAHLSLVDFHPDRRTFSVHRLVQAAARDALGDAAPAWSNSALRAVHSAFPVPEFRTWPACERLVAHVRAVASHVTEDSRELAWLLGTTGDYLRERAALAEVLPLYERTRAIFERSPRSDPDNAGGSATSRSARRIGDVRARRAIGRRAEGLSRRAARSARSWPRSDPNNAGWQRDLSVSFDRIGDVRVAQGDRAGALEAFEQSRAIARQLAARDPDNAEWQRDLSVSLEQDRRRAGGAGRSRGRAGGLRAEPGDQPDSWPRATPTTPSGSATSRSVYERIGDVRVAQGDRRALASSRPRPSGLAARDPNNAGGSATSRSVAGSATCGWRRAIARARGGLRAGRAIATSWPRAQASRPGQAALDIRRRSSRARSRLSAGWSDPGHARLGDARARSAGALWPRSLLLDAVAAGDVAAPQ